MKRTLVTARLLVLLPLLLFLSACTENSLKTGPLLLRALGLCLTTQFACDVCKDAGETAIAARLETAGRAALLLLAMPLFSSLLEQALSLLGC